MTYKRLVRRLRGHEAHWYENGATVYADTAAADAIEHLAQERDEALEALDDLVMMAELPGDHSEVPQSVERARSILSKHEAKMDQTEVTGDEGEEKSGWQPEAMSDLCVAVRRLERELPGWWWSVGACHVSADSSIGPDSDGPDAYLLSIESRIFDEGFHNDLRQPATCAEALHGAIDMALAAKAEYLTSQGDRSDDPTSSAVSMNQTSKHEAKP